MCLSCEKCGGCLYAKDNLQTYQKEKFDKFKQILSPILSSEQLLDSPIFIPDNSRRRTSMAFLRKKDGIILGYNEKSSHNLINISHCPNLTNKLNSTLSHIHKMIEELCTIKTTKRQKSKLLTTQMSKGDVVITEADNGLDIVLEIDSDISLDHRMIVSDYINNNDNIIRISHRRNNLAECEVLVEKLKPIINISGIEVFISPGTFLQPSKAGEQALVNTAMKYIGNQTGNIADLFCGIGTFSYPLSLNNKNHITSVDSSTQLLNGFQQTINKNQISNIKIINQNLFKYPIENEELQKLDIVILDPPRAGAKAQVKEIYQIQNNETSKLKTIVYVSCNPTTFCNDAKILIDSGYELQKITFVDQFIYSNHFELVALFIRSIK